jgi:hypothetical protein
MIITLVLPRVIIGITLTEIDGVMVIGSIAFGMYNPIETHE